VADDPALALRVALAREPVEEAVLRARDTSGTFRCSRNSASTSSRSRFAQEAVVDEHAGESIGDRLVHEHGRHR